ncbi:MAG: hypothetical protein E7514_07055 [Ruminococcaceae bacterium]|nr:hypothetical protein [Oscillospiraceae bacterium]
MHFRRILSILLSVLIILSLFSINAFAYSATYAEVFMYAAQQFNISPYHIASRVVQEVGANGSTSTSGTNSTYPGIYNFYNIGANTGVMDGLRWANGGEDGSATTYGRPWTSPYKSIYYGAQYIAAGYISVGQSTLYTQKFDIIAKGGYYNHQYMSNIQAPYTEAKNVYKAYQNLGIIDSAFVFTIPVYNNMPASPEQLPVRSSNPNYTSDTAGLSGYSSSSLPSSGVVSGATGGGLNMRSGPSTSYGVVAVLDNGTVVSIHSQSGNWYYVSCVDSSSGITYKGYVSSNYISTGNSNSSYITTDVPAIYSSYIAQVKSEHPNWKFKFFYTGLNWADVVYAETRKGKNVVTSAVNPISFRSTEINYDSSTNTYTPIEGKSWFQAHGQVVKHYLDPRNFITDTSVFMFEELSYDESVHHIDGVMAILKGTFMDQKSINTDVQVVINEKRLFPDVPYSAWYYKAVKYVFEKQIIVGYQNGLFGPEDNLQRQDFAVILSKIAAAKTQGYDTGQLTFPDADPTAYYAKSIAWAVDKGIVHGYQNGSFGTGDHITREQMCTIIYNYAKSIFCDMSLSRSAESILSKFTDNGSISPYARTPIAWCVDIGIISGKDAYHIAPAQTAVRAEIASLVQRICECGLAYEGYSDVSMNSWYYDAVQFCTNKGCMSGSNGYFNVSNTIQKQDFMVVLSRFSGDNLRQYPATNSGFTDVAYDSYYSSAVAWALDNGIITNDSSIFGVGEALTREEICHYLYKYCEAKNLNIELSDTSDYILSAFSDADSVSEKYQNDVAFCIENGIISGNAEGKINPNSFAARAETAVIMMNMYYRLFA